MYAAPLILKILDVLRRYTDEDHTLTQKEIVDILRRDYDTVVDRKAVSRNIENLKNAGYKIRNGKEIQRVVHITETIEDADGNKKRVSVVDPVTSKPEVERSRIQTDLYLEHDFTGAELRLLIDSVIFSKHIPRKKCQELALKLRELSSRHFRARVKHIATFPAVKDYNEALFDTIDILDEAISKGLQVSFSYCEYGTDKMPHRKRRPDGSVREYVCSPYAMAANDGKYYLICNYDKYNDISNYRIDRITDIKLLETRAKPFRELEGAGMHGYGLDLETYMREHIYMFSSGTVRVKFRIVRAMIGDVIDVFGENVRFSDETEAHVTVSAYVNELAMAQYAKGFAPDVIVLEPKSLLERVRGDIEKTAGIYKELGM